MTRPNTAERFWNRVDRRGEDDCWEWMGSRNRKGYGTLGWHGRHARAHRLAYMLTHRIDWLTSQEHVLHSCDNPACCNPLHLFLGTNADNITDAMAKGRRRKGTDMHTVRLTESQVREILSQYDGTHGSFARFARRYGTSRQNIADIVRRKTWKHIE